MAPKSSVIGKLTKTTVTQNYQELSTNDTI